MAKFTQAQIDGCTIIKCTRQIKDGIHALYIFSVQDSEGYIYDWTDELLSENATDAEIKTAITNHLLKESKNKKVEISVDKKDNLLNKKLSQI